MNADDARFGAIRRWPRDEAFAAQVFRNRQQTVADGGLFTGIEQSQSSRVAGLQQLRRRHEIGVIAECPAGIRIGKRLAFPNQMEVAVAVVLDGAHINQVASAADYVLSGEMDQVWRLIDLRWADHIGHGQKGRDGVERDGVNRFAQRLPAYSRRQPLDPAAGYGEARLAREVGDIDDIARVNHVGIFDLPVILPDLRPLPGFLQKAAGDVPQGIALLNHILVWVTLLEGNLRA